MQRGAASAKRSLLLAGNVEQRTKVLHGALIGSTGLRPARKQIGMHAPPEAGQLLYYIPTCRLSARAELSARSL